MIRALAIVALVAGSSCVWIASGQITKFSKRVVAIEQLEPDAEALGRGDTASTVDAVREMNQWAEHIGQRDLPPIERQQLVDRIVAGRRRYVLAAARLANTPDLGYALARTVLAAGDTEALATVRELSAARAKRRQDLFATAHTYKIDLGDDPVWKTTSRGMMVVGGQVVASHTSAELVERTGNCVFATRPFGSEGTPNPGLTFRLVGRSAFHVRCYLRRDPTGLPRADGAWVIGKTAGGYAVNSVTPSRSPAMYRDFVLTPTSDPSDHFADLQFDLSYDYSDGFVVVWERGASRLRKRVRSLQLAGSPVFWERDD